MYIKSYTEDSINPVATAFNIAMGRPDYVINYNNFIKGLNFNANFRYNTNRS